MAAEEPKPDPGAERNSAAPDREVDPRLVDLFQEAVAYARSGDHARALVAYRAVLLAYHDDRLTAAPRFIATTQLQCAYALIDLDKLDEAEPLLDALDHHTFTGPQLYDFYFTRGNVYGALGRLPEMFAAFVEAISTAEDLDDYTERPAICWTKMLTFAVHFKDWDFVLELADKADQAASLRGFSDIHTTAAAARDIARAEIGEAN
jgi:tetratricopeptide (TPR) repeat protein